MVHYASAVMPQAAGAHRSGGNVPKKAMPEMLTAGPTVSDGKASRLLLVNCARALPQNLVELVRRIVAPTASVLLFTETGGCVILGKG